MDLVQHRLRQQQLAAPAFDQPEAVAGWLGAVQAQDYAAAKWAVGLRLPEATDAGLDAAFAAGTLLRTHVLRPTWHFVTPTDIRWMLALTAPHVHAQVATWYRKLNLDAPLFAATERVLVAALQGGHQRTRAELGTALTAAGIDMTEDLRLTHVMMHAELEGVVCSGGRRGKQFTYALLDERAPAARVLPREEALAELTRRYFTSHGPATAQDFRWWSGLSLTDVRAGLATVAPDLEQAVVDGQTYWFAPLPASAPAPAPPVQLLPNYDEYIVGYTDRRALFDTDHVHTLDPRGNILFSHTVVLDGRIAGTWKRILKKNAVVLEAALLTSLDEAATAAFTAAAERYGTFLNLPVIIEQRVAPEQD
jgi:hypothetical protein